MIWFGFQKGASGSYWEKFTPGVKKFRNEGAEEYSQEMKESE